MGRMVFERDLDDSVNTFERRDGGLLGEDVVDGC